MTKKSKQPKAKDYEREQRIETEKEVDRLSALSPRYFYMTRSVELNDVTIPPIPHVEYEVREFTTKEELDYYLRTEGLDEGSETVKCFIAKRLELKVDLTLSE